MSETRHTFVLRPHRSLGAGAFLCLMVFYGGVSFVAGLYFLSLGAWPVCGFFGLDVLLLYLAFRANYRSAHLCETIEIDAAELVVTTRDVRGRTMRTTLNPYWLRVQLVEFAGGISELRLTLRERSLVIGRFLSDPERRDLATALRSALAR